MYEAHIYKVLARAKHTIEAQDTEELIEIMDNMEANNEYDFETCEGEQLHYSWSIDPEDLEAALKAIGCE